MIEKMRDKIKESKGGQDACHVVSAQNRDGWSQMDAHDDDGEITPGSRLCFLSGLHLTVSSLLW